MKKTYFPEWDEIDEHDLQMELANHEVFLLRTKYLSDLQWKLDQLYQKYPFTFLNTKIKTMGIEGSFFQGDAYESINGIDGGTFILELTFLKIENRAETSVNTWVGKGQFHRKIFFFPNDNIDAVKEYLDSI